MYSLSDEWTSFFHAEFRQHLPARPRNRPPSFLSMLPTDVAHCCSMVDARATRTSRARGTLATPTEGWWRGAGSAGDAPNCEHQDFAARQSAAAKHIYMYDVPAGTGTCPALPPAPPPSACPAARQATRHGQHPSPRHPRTCRALAPPSHAKTVNRAGCSASRPTLGHFVTTQTSRLRHHARRGMCRRRPPAHRNRPQVQLLHFQPMISRHCRNAPAYARRLPPTGKTPSPCRTPPLHASAHMPGPPNAPPLPRARHAIRHLAATPSDALADAPLLAQNQRPDAFLPFAA
jgi:hypothetical protein